MEDSPGKNIWLLLVWECRPDALLLSSQQCQSTVTVTKILKKINRSLQSVCCGILSGDVLFYSVIVWLVTSMWQVCRDFLVGRCNRSNCRYVHSAEAKVAETRQRSDGSSDVCKDFLNGRCNRTMCRYYHPPMTQQPQPTQAAPTVMSSAAESTVCVT